MFCFSRNMKKFPRTPSMKGYILQFMAILSLLGPKICLASVTVINAPYQFGLLYLVEYLFLLMHNIILYRDFCGNHSLIKNLKSPTKSRFFCNFSFRYYHINHVDYASILSTTNIYRAKVEIKGLGDFCKYSRKIG